MANYYYDLMIKTKKFPHSISCNVKNLDVLLKRGLHNVVFKEVSVEEFNDDDYSNSLCKIFICIQKNNKFLI